MLTVDKRIELMTRTRNTMCLSGPDNPLISPKTRERFVICNEDDTVTTDKEQVLHEIKLCRDRSQIYSGCQNFVR